MRRVLDNVVVRLAAYYAVISTVYQSSESAQPNGHVVLEYRITLKKSQSPDSLVSTISRLGIPEIGGVALTTDS